MGWERQKQSVKRSLTEMRKSWGIPLEFSLGFAANG